MKIETTINVGKEVLNKLNSSAEILNVKRNELILLLLLSAMKWGKNSIKIQSSVKYQKSSENQKFKKIHFTFKGDIYEKCIDMRKLYKLSVSFILALAVEKCLEKIIHNLKSTKIKNITDNYHSNYLFITNNDEKFFSFTIFWDYPDQKTILKYLN